MKNAIDTRPTLATTGSRLAKAREIAARAEALRALALFTTARPSWVGAL